MDFTKYIKSLLITNDKLFIPGLGTFLTDYKPAGIIKEHNIMVPPSKDVRFDSDLKEDDGILVNYIIKKERISSDKAKEEVNIFVKNIIALLNEAKSFDIPGIGSFRKINGTIQFQSAITENLLADSYGLPNIPAFVEPVKKESAKTAAKKDTESPASKTAPVANVSSGSAKWVLIGIAAPVFIVLIFVFLILPNTEFFNDFNEAEKIPVVIEAPENSVVTGGISNADSTEPITDEIIRVEDKYAHCKNFYIIAGSFKTQNLASRLKIRFIKLGFPADTLHYRDNFRVYLKKFNNRSEALKELNRLKAQNMDVWLLSV